MCRFRRKSNFLFEVLLIFTYCGFTSVKSDGEENPAATVPTPSSTQRSILVLKISPNFNGGGGSGSADGDEFIRNLNKRLEGYKKRISEYDTSNSNVRHPGDSHSHSSHPPIRNSHYPYEYPYKPPLEDLDYHTNAILYFIAISIVIVAIGVVSCLCINKSTCHKAVGEMTARANAASASSSQGNTRRGTGANNNRGSRVNSNLSIISGTTTATSFSASPSVTNVNFSAGANSSPSSHYNNAHFDDGIQTKVIHDLPPSYESLFPPPTPTVADTTAPATENDSNSTDVNTVSVSATTMSATANENNVETAKT